MTDQRTEILSDYIDPGSVAEWYGTPSVPPELLWGILYSYWEHFLAAGIPGLKMRELPPGAPTSGVTALEAVAASSILTAQIGDARWWMAAEARKQGCSWSEIGGALGMSKQAAWEGFRKYAAERSGPVSAVRLSGEYQTLAGDSADG
jgi:hypothetical protein